MDNYKLIALDKAENAKLGKAKLGRGMPKGWQLGENFWWQRYFNSEVAKIDGYQNYPKSDKAPDNLLKLGITMVQLGEKEQGCTMITGIKKQYPKASKSVLQKAQYEQKKFNCSKT